MNDATQQPKSDEQQKDRFVWKPGDVKVVKPKEPSSVDKGYVGGEKDQYYILTTKFSDCLNRVVESGRFHYLRHAQPGSGSFLDEVAALPLAERPNVTLVLFDRVQGSGTFKKLQAIYLLRDVVCEEEAYKGQRQYALLLDKVQDINPPSAFGQGADLWDRLSTTRGMKTTTFYNGGRMLLRIPRDDFETILESQTVIDVEEDEYDDASSTALTAGVPLLAETELHAYLAENLDRIESDLQPYDPDDYFERQTDVGRIDLLCRDGRGDIVVVELKKGRADDKVVGQLARYMGWVGEKLWTDGAAVRGIIVANIVSEKLRYAAKAFPNVRLVEYQVEFKLRPVEP